MSDIEIQLNRLNKLSTAQLSKVLMLLPTDPSPEWVKQMIQSRVSHIIKNRHKDG